MALFSFFFFLACSISVAIISARCPCWANVDEIVEACNKGPVGVGEDCLFDDSRPNNPLVLTCDGTLSDGAVLEDKYLFSVDTLQSTCTIERKSCTIPGETDSDTRMITTVHLDICIAEILEAQSQLLCDVPHFCEDTPFECGDTPVICGVAGDTFTECVCDFDVEGNPGCFENTICYNQCSTNAQCAAGQSCYGVCCGTGGIDVCLDNCVNPFSRRRMLEFDSDIVTEHNPRRLQEECHPTARSCADNGQLSVSVDSHVKNYEYPVNVNLYSAYLGSITMFAVIACAIFAVLCIMNINKDKVHGFFHGNKYETVKILPSDSD